MRTWLMLGMICWLLANVVRGQRTIDWLTVPGATATAIGVLFSHGYDDDAVDECGTAHVLARCRLEQARRAVPDALATGMHVGHRHALVFAVVAASDAARAVRFARAVLPGPCPLADDDLLRLVAKVALVADDAEFLYPGSSLETRARRQLFAGTSADRPPAGIAAAVIGLQPATVRERLAVGSKVRVAVLGAADVQLRRALAAIAWPPPESAVRAVAEATGEPRSEMSVAPNSRTDSPYVAAAFVAPTEQRAAFAVAIEVARARAHKRWRMRGQELFARAPFVAWSWLHAEPMAILFRRGEEPQHLLPGQRPEATAQAELAATRAELDQLLRELHEVPVRASEVQAARRLLQAQLGLDVADGAGWAAEPATYPGRLQVLLLSAHHGVDVAELDTVDVGAVQRALQRQLHPERASWHALLPVESARLGFRTR